MSKEKKDNNVMKKREMILVIVAFLIAVLFFDLTFGFFVIESCGKHEGLIVLLSVTACGMIHISLIACLLKVIFSKKNNFNYIWYIILFFVFIIPIALYFSSSMIRDYDSKNGLTVNCYEQKWHEVDCLERDSEGNCLEYDIQRR